MVQPTATTIATSGVRNRNYQINLCPYQQDCKRLREDRYKLDRRTALGPVPFWLPTPITPDKPLKYFEVGLNHVRQDFNLLRVCVTDINSTHGLCHYMNSTEEEGQMLGNDADVYLGVFAFPLNTFTKGDTIQFCVKSISLHEEKCRWESNVSGSDIRTIMTGDMSTFGQHQKIIEKSEIFNHAPMSVSGIV